MRYVLREARDCIFLRAPGACPARLQQRPQGSMRKGNERRAARGELLPGSRGQVSVSWLTAVPAVMNEALWVIHGPRSQGGAGGAAWAPNPASHHVSPSRLGLPRGNSLCPFCVSVTRHELLCLLSSELQPFCLAFERLPRLCLFSLLFQTFFVSFWLS